MLTDADIKKLTKVLATKQDLKKVEGHVEKVEHRLIGIEQHLDSADERLTRMEGLLDGVITAIDALRKAIEDLRMEYVSISIQLSRHDRWIQQIAAKVGERLEV